MSYEVTKGIVSVREVDGSVSDSGDLPTTTTGTELDPISFDAFSRKVFDFKSPRSTRNKLELVQEPIGRTNKSTFLQLREPYDGSVGSFRNYQVLYLNDQKYFHGTKISIGGEVFNNIQLMADNGNLISVTDKDGNVFNTRIAAVEDQIRAASDPIDGELPTTIDEVYHKQGFRIIFTLPVDPYDPNSKMLEFMMNYKGNLKHNYNYLYTNIDLESVGMRESQDVLFDEEPYRRITTPGPEVYDSEKDYTEKGYEFGFRINLDDAPHEVSTDHIGFNHFEYLGTDDISLIVSSPILDEFRALELFLTGTNEEKYTQVFNAIRTILNNYNVGYSHKSLKQSGGQSGYYNICHKMDIGTQYLFNYDQPQYIVNGLFEENISYEFDHDVEIIIGSIVAQNYQIQLIDQVYEPNLTFEFNTGKRIIDGVTSVISNLYSKLKDTVANISPLDVSDKLLLTYVSRIYMKSSVITGPLFMGDVESNCKRLHNEIMDEGGILRWFGSEISINVDQIIESILALELQLWNSYIEFITTKLISEPRSLVHVGQFGTIAVAEYMTIIAQLETETIDIDMINLGYNVGVVMESYLNEYGYRCAYQAMGMTEHNSSGELDDLSTTELNEIAEIMQSFIGNLQHEFDYSTSSYTFVNDSFLADIANKFSRDVLSRISYYLKLGADYLINQVHELLYVFTDPYKMESGLYHRINESYETYLSLPLTEEFKMVKTYNSIQDSWNSFIKNSDKDDLSAALLAGKVVQFRLSNRLTLAIYKEDNTHYYGKIFINFARTNESLSTAEVDNEAIEALNEYFYIMNKLHTMGLDYHTLSATSTLLDPNYPVLQGYDRVNLEYDLDLASDYEVPIWDCINPISGMTAIVSTQLLKNLSNIEEYLNSRHSIDDIFVKTVNLGVFAPVDKTEWILTPTMMLNYAVFDPYSRSKGSWIATGIIASMVAIILLRRGSGNIPMYNPNGEVTGYIKAGTISGMTQGRYIVYESVRAVMSAATNSVLAILRSGSSLVSDLITKGILPLTDLSLENKIDNLKDDFNDFSETITELTSENNSQSETLSELITAVSNNRKVIQALYDDFRIYSLTP